MKLQKLQTWPKKLLIKTLEVLIIKLIHRHKNAAPRSKNIEMLYNFTNRNHSQLNYLKEEKLKFWPNQTY